MAVLSCRCRATAGRDGLVPRPAPFTTRGRMKGAMILTVDLPMLELLALARTSDARILELADAEVACLPAEGLLQSAPFSGATRLR